MYLFDQECAKVMSCGGEIDFVVKLKFHGPFLNAFRKTNLLER